MKVRDAVSAGITLGVAFSGMTMLISYMTGAITPAAQAMSETVGVDLPITDGGWTTMSTISWSWPYAFLMFPLVIGINILLIVFKRTETFNADLWNVWGKIFTAVAVYSITSSVWAAFAVAAVQVVFELKTADFHQHRVETMTGIPGVTITHRMVFLAAPMYPIGWLLRKIPGLDRSFNAADLRAKVGIFAENHILGFILGVLFGVLARFDVAGASASTTVSSMSDWTGPSSAAPTRSGSPSSGGSRSPWPSPSSCPATGSCPSRASSTSAWPWPPTSPPRATSSGCSSSARSSRRSSCGRAPRSPPS
ncbi:PTS transporter subunit IIC [Actinomyces sp.]|uniref:PTS transporter subunit IIC n=1 Tax=Actinomyces sp. TaxID=29317 RepID=UPI0034C68459